MVQQLETHLRSLAHLEDTSEENYSLTDEIDLCLSGFIANRWDKNIQVLLPSSELPPLVVGDLSKFRICFRTLLEFGIKYCANAKFEMKCKVERMLQEVEGRKMMLIKFKIVMSKNSAFDLRALKLLCPEQADNASLEEYPIGIDQKKAADISQIMSENYASFHQHMSHFGFGMIMLPSLVSSMSGEFFVEDVELSVDHSASS